MNVGGPLNASPIRRLFAFYFDIYLFTMPAELILFLYDLDKGLAFISAYYGLGFAMLKIVTAIPLTAFCLAKFNNTPGKWLLGLKINTEEQVSFTYYFKRQLFAFAVGAGMQLSSVSVVALWLSLRSLRVAGITLWDKRFNTSVTQGALVKNRVVLFVIVTIAVSIIASLPMVIHSMPQLKAYYFSPTYISVTASSGSVTYENIELKAESEGVGVDINRIRGGNIFTVTCKPNELDTLIFNINHPTLPEGFTLEVFLNIRDTEDLLGLSFKLLLNELNGKLNVSADVSVMNRSSRKPDFTIYSEDMSLDEPVMSMYVNY